MRWLIAGLLLAATLAAQDSWDTVPKPGDPDPFRPGKKAGPIARTRDGKPDLSGVWQEHTLANWDVEKRRGEYGAPGSPGIVEGGRIPYQESALAKRAAIAKTPPSGCDLPGVPRIAYMPYAFQMVETPGGIHAEYEYMHAWRVFHLDRTAHPENIVETFDGDSVAHWDGDSLVVDVQGFNAKTWLDMAGDYHSDQLHVVERYTPVDANTLWYEATIQDPKVYTHPWRLRLPLHRQAQNFELMEYDCGSSPAALFSGAQ